MHRLLPFPGDHFGGGRRGIEVEGCVLWQGVKIRNGFGRAGTSQEA